MRRRIIIINKIYKYLLSFMNTYIYSANIVGVESPELSAERLIDRQ